MDSCLIRSDLILSRWWSNTGLMYCFKERGRCRCIWSWSLTDWIGMDPTGSDWIGLERNTTKRKQMPFGGSLGDNPDQEVNKSIPCELLYLTCCHSRKVLFVLSGVLVGLWQSSRDGCLVHARSNATNWRYILCKNVQRKFKNSFLFFFSRMVSVVLETSIEVTTTREM